MPCPKCGASSNDFGVYHGWYTQCLKCQTKESKMVKIGSKEVGPGRPIYLVGDIGINHNGDLDIAKHLIDVAYKAGWDAVKFQKRTIDVVYSPEELAKPRESIFGFTNGDLKRGLEFGLPEYEEIDAYCKNLGITWYASAWDEGSADFIDRFDVPCFKIASASLTDDALLKHIKSKGKPIIMSTGMSTLSQIDHAVDILGKRDLILLHTCSAYPSRGEDLNLRVINTLQKRYGLPIGYSGHETGIPPSTAAVALGVCMIERHITLDRAMWGSDQAASLGPSGIVQLVRDIRLVEMSMGDGVKRILDSEIPVMKKLRRK